MPEEHATPSPTERMPWEQIWQEALAAHQQHQLSKAIASYRQVLAQNPQFADAHANLAMALAATTQIKDADQAFCRAISLQPDHALHHSNYGFFLNSQGQWEKAEHHLRQAIRLDPQLAIAWTNLGDVLRSLDRWDESVFCYQTAWPLDSNRLETLSDWIFGLLKLCRFAAQDPVALTLIQASAHQLSLGKISPINAFVGCFLPLSPEQQYHICRSQALALEQTLEGQKAGFPFIRRSEIRENNKPSKIRLGYVCAAFSRHPTGHLMEGMFERHDRARFEIYGYATQPDDGSSYRQKIAVTIDHFRPVHDRSLQEIAEQIYRDRIDILIDLDGYTTHHRQAVFALKPAPIQITWFGFPGTTGADYMDYLIADEIVIPAKSDRFYTEKILRLPVTYQVNNHRQLPPIMILNSEDRINARRAVGFPENKFVFCSFNNNAKIDRGTFEAWLRILQGVPDSILWILMDTKEALENLKRAATQVGISPDRIIAAERMSEPLAHIERMQLADLYLDCLICNAHTTASDSLWAGVPVLTCPGETFASRVGASLVQAAQLPDLICISVDAFVDKAIELAHHPKQLNTYRSHLQKQKASLPLFNTDQFVEDLELALIEVYQQTDLVVPPQTNDAKFVNRPGTVQSELYSLYIVSPPGYIHVHAFDEFALTLQTAFKSLRYKVPLIRNPQEIVGTPIVLGAHLLPKLPQIQNQLPTSAILFNLEQISPDSSWIDPDYLDLLKSYQVWDYSDRNIQLLTNTYGIENVVHCPIGYVPDLTCITPALEPEIDVLFYGSLNDRRKKILQELNNAGVNVKALVGIYGKERDHYIANSKLVLNIHYYESKVPELIRLSYLLANKICIVSETGSDDTFETTFQAGIVFTNYNNLVSTCLDWVYAAPQKRIALAQHGHELFQTYDQVGSLKQALTKTQGL